MSSDWSSRRARGLNMSGGTHRFGGRRRRRRGRSGALTDHPLDVITEGCSDTAGAVGDFLQDLECRFLAESGQLPSDVDVRPRLLFVGTDFTEQYLHRLR